MFLLDNVMTRRLRIASLAILSLLPAASWCEAVVGIEQKLGASLPLDAQFVDENGAAVTIGQLLGKPTILAFVYYTCPNVCDYLLTNLAGTLTSVAPDAGIRYNVLTISINPAETAADARKAKRIGLETVQAPFAADAWRFLVGDEKAIEAVTGAAGFHYRAVDGYYDHPVALMVLSAKGTIVRYMYGDTFLPADLQLALLQAEKGIVAPSIAKLLRICFSVDPVSHQLVFRTLRVVATVTLVAAGAFVLYLLLSGRKRRRAGRDRPTRPAGAP
jgi:protein SCO1/2